MPILHRFCLITSLVVMLLFGGTGRASAQVVDENGRDVSRPRHEILNDEVVTLDPDRIIGFSSLSLWTGYDKVVRRGDERATSSPFGGGEIELRYRGWMLGNSFSLQPGGDLKIEGSGYTLPNWYGRNARIMVGPDVALIHVSEDNPLGLLTTSLLFGFDNETGESRDSNYIMRQGTIELEWKLNFEFYGFRIRTGQEMTTFGDLIATGWFRTLAVLWDLQQPISASRSSTSTRSGFHDGPSNKQRADLKLRTTIYTTAYALGRIDMALDLGLLNYHASGFRSLSDGHPVDAFYFGPFFRVGVLPGVHVSASISYEHEIQTGRGSMVAFLAVDIDGLAEQLEEKLRK